MEITYCITGSKVDSGGMITTTHALFQTLPSGEQTRVGTLRRYEELGFTCRADLIFQGSAWSMEEGIAYLEDPNLYPHHICPYMCKDEEKPTQKACLHKLFSVTKESYLECDHALYPVIRNEREGVGQVYDAGFAREGNRLVYPVLAKYRRTGTGGQEWEATLTFAREVPQQLCMAVLMTLL